MDEKDIEDVQNWLNRGFDAQAIEDRPMRNYLYQDVDGVSYVGRTVHPEIRNAQHAGSHSGDMVVQNHTWNGIPGLTVETADLSTNQSRAVEQLMINQNGGVAGLDNACNEIAPSRNISDGALKWAAYFIK